MEKTIDFEGKELRELVEKFFQDEAPKSLSEKELEITRIIIVVLGGQLMAHTNPSKLLTFLEKNDLLRYLVVGTVLKNLITRGSSVSID